MFSRLRHSRRKFHVPDLMAFIITFSAMAAMLPVMTKLSFVLRSECVNTFF